MVVLLTFSHSSVKVTLDVYGHLMPGMQAEALGHLDGMFS